MTPDEQTAFKRAVEGGAFEDYYVDWHSRDDVGEHCEADTLMLHALFEKASDFLGRKLAPTKDVWAVLVCALFAPVDAKDERHDRCVRFVLARYFDQPWPEGE